MGMYTEIVVNARIKNDPKVVEIIRRMIGDIPHEIETPNHPLFNDGNRWKIMLRCCSYYHVPTIVHHFVYDDISKYWCFVNRSDFKDYSGESVMFFDWLRTVLDDSEEDVMIGYTRYEEYREPIIYYSKA